MYIVYKKTKNTSIIHIKENSYTYKTYKQTKKRNILLNILEIKNINTYIQYICIFLNYKFIIKGKYLTKEIILI